MTGNDILTVSFASNTYTFVLNSVSYPLSGTGVTQLNINVADGNDRVTVGTTVKVQALIFGGIGNDTLRGGDGNDSLEGGAGTDVLFWDPGNETLVGGSGTDSADYTNLSGVQLDITLDGLANDYVRQGSTILENDYLAVENVAGTSGNDTLRGNSGDNELVGLGGNDDLYGAGGNDILRGGVGLDFLFGEAGQDTLYGDDDNDELVGGGATDSMRGGSGDDVLDALDGAPGDILFGESGTDTPYIDSGDSYTP